MSLEDPPIIKSLVEIDRRLDSLEEALRVWGAALDGLRVEMDRFSGELKQMQEKGQESEALREWDWS